MTISHITFPGSSLCIVFSFACGDFGFSVFEHWEDRVFAYRNSSARGNFTSGMEKKMMCRSVENGEEIEYNAEEPGRPGSESKTQNK